MKQMVHSNYFGAGSMLIWLIFPIPPLTNQRQHVPTDNQVIYLLCFLLLFKQFNPLPPHFAKSE